MIKLTNISFVLFCFCSHQPHHVRAPHQVVAVARVAEPGHAVHAGGHRPRRQRPRSAPSTLQHPRPGPLLPDQDLAGQQVLLVPVGQREGQMDRKVGRRYFMVLV